MPPPVSGHNRLSTAYCQKVGPHPNALPVNVSCISNVALLSAAQGKHFRAVCAADTSDQPACTAFMLLAIRLVQLIAGGLESFSDAMSLQPSGHHSGLGHLSSTITGFDQVTTHASALIPALYPGQSETCIVVCL